MDNNTAGTGTRGDGLRPDSHLLYHEMSRAIIGRFFETHTELGYGFVEPIYANALTIMLRDAGLVVAREVKFDVRFRGRVIGRHRADMIVGEKIIVEVKTGRSIHPTHEAQLRSYLKATNLALGLLLNFGPKAEFRRLIWTPKGNIASMR
jgi:GxxExxY protein